MSMRELSDEKCSELGALLSRHLLLKVWPPSGFPKFILLDKVANKQRGTEEVANKAVVAKHLECLLEIFYGFPHAAPAKSSLREAFSIAIDKIDLGDRGEDALKALKVKQYKWCRDESDKLHMCWRYGWGSYMRPEKPRLRSEPDQVGIRRRT